MPDEFPPADEPMARSDEPIELEDDEDVVDADEALNALNNRLDEALSSLNARNSRIEEYLQQLKAERRRELEGTNADQLTFDDQQAKQDVQPGDTRAD